MERRDEEVRDGIIDRLAKANIDQRSLAVEVTSGGISISGSVPTEEERQRLGSLFQDAVNLQCRVDVRPVVGSDVSDGRGRSPITGTSAESQHESQHQLDKD